MHGTGKRVADVTYVRNASAPAFAQFLAICKDAVHNRALMATKLQMPVLAIGGVESFRPNQAVVLRDAADNATEFLVPAAGHWLMGEAPTQTVAAMRGFLDAP